MNINVIGVVAHPKMTSGQIKPRTCAWIVKMMNKMKEIIKEGWDVFPPWLLVGHGLLITVSFLIILFI